MQGVLYSSICRRVSHKNRWNYKYYEEVSCIKKLQTDFTVLSPDIPEELDEVIFPDRKICDEDYFEMGIISNCIIEHEVAAHVFFDKVIFRNVIFQKVDFSKLELTDVIFERCDLSNVDLNEAIMHQVEMRSCKIVGINLMGATLRNVLFDTCYGDYANFRNVNCKQVQFHNSSLANADFYSSTLHKVYFSHSRLDQIQLSGTKLAGIDLSSCEFSHIGITIEDVQGCIVSPQQAVGFSKLFGLIIKE